MKYIKWLKPWIKPIALVLLGSLLMLMFSNSSIKLNILVQHAVSGTGEDIWTNRFGLESEPTREFQAIDLFGDDHKSNAENN